MNTLIIVALLVLIPTTIVLFVSELMKKDNEIIMWQREYAELATELELVRLGVSK